MTGFVVGERVVRVDAREAEDPVVGPELVAASSRSSRWARSAGSGCSGSMGTSCRCARARDVEEDGEAVGHRRSRLRRVRRHRVRTACGTCSWDPSAGSARRPCRGSRPVPRARRRRRRRPRRPSPPARELLEAGVVRVVLRVLARRTAASRSVIGSGLRRASVVRQHLQVHVGAGRRVRRVGARRQDAHGGRSASGRRTRSARTTTLRAPATSAPSGRRAMAAHFMSVLQPHARGWG